MLLREFRLRRLGYLRFLPLCGRVLQSIDQHPRIDGGALVATRQTQERKLLFLAQRARTRLQLPKSHQMEAPDLLMERSDAGDAISSFFHRDQP